MDEMENKLFEHAMKGQWDKIVECYEKDSNTHRAKITKSLDTALHIAVLGGQTAVVLKMIGIIGDNASNILQIKNERGNTALHLAATIGNVELCQFMAENYPELISAKNNEGETPLFSSVVHGNKEAFLCLYHFHSPKPDYNSCQKKNGDTILHCAISGEYFSLAFQILIRYPKLVNYPNENHLSPLHVLASKPKAFKSTSRLALFDRIIYQCIIVDPLKEEKHKPEAYSHTSAESSKPKYPENYETCMTFFGLIRTCFKVLTKTQKNKDIIDVENPQQKSSSKSHGEGTAEASSSAIKSESNATTEEPSDAMESRSKSSQNNLEKEEGGEDRYFPPNYATCVLFFKLMMSALLIILGLGIWRIHKIKRKKEKHTWSAQVMSELIKKTSLYKYEQSGSNLRQADKHEVPTSPDDHEKPQHTDTNVEINSSTTIQIKDQNRREQNGEEKRDNPVLVAARWGVTEMVDKFISTYPAAMQELNSSDKNLVLLTFEKKKTDELAQKESPILIAAKMGVAEMVEEILDVYPVAIQDVDSDEKNILLLAVENRQTHIYQLLQKRELLKESLFRKLDNEGNSALHLAAMYGNCRPWHIPGAALQMQWEIKWYKFVKKSMPPHFYDRYNKKGHTPKQIFMDTHKGLVKEGSEWLMKTSESCSVVAALIATVAFATSSTVPGGNDKHGKPVLDNEPGFSVFAISSLVALCFSVTAMVLFLSILTSRCQEKDFSMDLPRKLLLGLTSLFTSIASILVSFCAGHFFELNNNLRYAVYPIYASTCFPVTFFAIVQLRLYFDLIQAIFMKVPQRSYTALTFAG